jgi:dipeptidyl aminopeptidase/acylaminoacyl peptidase
MAGAEVPPNLTLEGLSEPSASLRASAARYLEFPSARFLDWHPRRRDMLVTSRAGDTAQLHRVQSPGAARRQLTFAGEPVTWGAWQPRTAGSVVFSQDQGGGEFFQLHRWDATTEVVSLLTDGTSRNTAARWSASGRQIAYGTTRRNGRDVDLWRMDPSDPAGARVLLELEGGGGSVLDWSADERRVLVLDQASVHESRLYLVDIGGGSSRRLAPLEGGRGSYTGGRFLPGDREILVAGDRGSEFVQLAKLDLSTGLETPFGPRYGGDIEEFEVSPDGTTVACFVNEDAVSRLHRLELRTGRELPVPELPVGVASGLRWRASGREIGFTFTSARSPADAYSVDFRTAGVTRWTDGGRAGLFVKRFAEPERVRVRSFDGLGLAGFLYRPDAVRFPGPRPVLVTVHGGPEGQARPVFQARWNHLIEEMGVAILHPDVRGSTGYGKTFHRLDDGVRREDAVRDIGAFLDWIRGEPGLDAGRVAIHGSSYGGYMVLASLAQHGDRLRCGVDVVGMTRFTTFLRNTQAYRRDLRRVEYGDERDPAVAAFLERISPWNQVEWIRKPVLIVQGLNDPRVPAEESGQMIRALRDHGREVAYLLARDEGHGFARKGNADFLYLCLAGFLQQHLELRKDD